MRPAPNMAQNLTRHQAPGSGRRRHRVTGGVPRSLRGRGVCGGLQDQLPRGRHRRPALSPQERADRVAPTVAVPRSQGPAPPSRLPTPGLSPTRGRDLSGNRPEVENLVSPELRGPQPGAGFSFPLSPRHRKCARPCRLGASDPQAGRCSPRCCPRPSRRLCCVHSAPLQEPLARYSMGRRPRHLLVRPFK